MQKHNNTIKKKVLSEQIKEELMESILNGDIMPGQKLIENTLAKEFGVSQAPVREALRSLEALGFVSVEPYKGATVNKIGREEMHEYFVVRSALEGLAGRIAAEKITDEEIMELENLSKEMIAAAKEGDYERRAQINQIFHNLIIESSHNTILINACKTIRLGSWSRATSKHTNLDPELIATRHKNLIDLLKKRDGEGLEKELRLHISESFENFNQTLYADNTEQ